MYQGYFFRKIPDINASFAPKYVHLQGWPLKFFEDVKIFQPKHWNTMQEQTQVNKQKTFAFEQYWQTNQRMMNVHKKQFRSFEISGEEISFQIMIFYFQFWMFLLLALKSITQGKWCKRPSDPLSLLEYHFTLRQRL